MTAELPVPLLRLWHDFAGSAPAGVSRISPHASGRKIFRIEGADGQTVIGVENADREENAAFIAYSRVFGQGGLPVPDILASDDETAYLESDFGDETLFDHLETNRTETGPSARTEELYAQAVTDLVAFQTRGLDLLTDAGVLANERFDIDAMMDDFRYFTEEYADRVGLRAEAEAAGDSFAEVMARCAADPGGAFLYRDFQARNIMVGSDRLYYIDYQSGREGPMAYDLASLLFQARADLPFPFRDAMVERYVGSLPDSHAVSLEIFQEKFRDFVLLRAIQTLGAYGRFGLGQRKDYFLGAIPFARANAAYLAERLPADTSSRPLRHLLEKVSDVDAE